LYEKIICRNVIVMTTQVGSSLNWETIGMPDSIMHFCQSLSASDFGCRISVGIQLSSRSSAYLSERRLDQPDRCEHRDRSTVKIPGTGILVSQIGSRTDQPTMTMDVRLAVIRTHLTLPLCTIAVLPKLCRDHLCQSFQRLCTK
jgi:hypothetical protein